MDRMIFDSELRKRLNSGVTSLEFCDESGTVVAHYVPDRAYLEKMLEELATPQPLDDEQKRQAREEARLGQGVSSAQILARLEELRLACENSK